MEYLMTVLATFTIYHLLVGGLIFLVLVAAFKLFNVSAESQNWLWITAFIIACMLPFSLFFQNEPTKSLSNLSQPASQNAIGIDADAVTNTAPDILPLPISTAEPNKNQTVTLSFSSQWVYWLTPWFVFALCVWAAGCVWRTISIVQSMWKTKQMVKASRLFNETIDLGITQCEIRASSTIHSPLVVGLFNPVIVLPEDLLERLSVEQLRPIILHEWAHIRRKDLWTVVFQEAITIVFWWSPVVRLFNRKIYITRELACDLRAARVLANPKQYAECLLECARLMVTRRHDVLAMGMFRKKQDLNQRVDHVMKMENVKVHSIYISIVAIIVLVVAGIVVAAEVDQKIAIAKEDSRTLSEVEKSNINRDQAERMEKEKRLREMQARKLKNQGLIIEPIGEKEIREYVKSNSLLTIESLVCEVDLCELEIKSNEESGFAQQVSSLLRGLNKKYNTSVSASNLTKLTANISILTNTWPNIKHILRSGDIYPLDSLIAEGLDINGSIAGDGTPLIMAVRAQNRAMVEYLIGLGADVNLAAPRDGNPLIAAAKTGNTELAELLYQYGADINAVVQYDETPLINASRFGQFEMVKFLVERGADVNLGVDAKVRGNGIEYRSPLNQASNQKIREYLIQAGAQP